MWPCPSYSLGHLSVDFCVFPKLILKYPQGNSLDDFLPGKPQEDVPLDPIPSTIFFNLKDPYPQKQF